MAIIRKTINSIKASRAKTRWIIKKITTIRTRRETIWTKTVTASRKAIKRGLETTITILQSIASSNNVNQEKIRRIRKTRKRKIRKRTKRKKRKKRKKRRIKSILY